MAGLTKAQRAERDKPVDDGLVEVEKEGETMRVHPSCLKAHTRAGWHVKETEPC